MKSEAPANKAHAAREALRQRIDAELAAGQPVKSIDAEVAQAGIVHAVEVMFAWWGTLPGFEFHPDEGVVALTLTDLGGTMLLRPGRWRGVGQSAARPTTLSGRCAR